MATGTIRAWVYVALLGMTACGGSSTKAAGPTGGTAASGAADGGTAAAADAGPPERPFASNPLEAQSLIQVQIDKRMKQLWLCVSDWRAKKGNPHKALAVDVGIDQEGILMGVATPNPKQGDLDPDLRDCMMNVLRGAPFPRSHAGVITVRQTFEDTSVTQ
jgi:hypothetical protein